jgi:PAS domain S-box-containing protein
MEYEFSRVVDALPGLVWTALSDGRVDFVNRRWCDYTGAGVDEVLGQGWQRAVHPDDLPELLERWRNMPAAGDMEARLRRFDGTYRRFLFRAAPIADASAGWCGIGTDVEERGRMTRVSSLGALPASIAHEMNQPLSGVITNASTCLRMLAADPPNIDGARETARRMIRDGNRASNVITRLQALFSKQDTTIEQADLNDATEVRREEFVMVTRSLVSVVDDDQSVRESLPDLLREFGFAAQAFASAEEFLASEYLAQTRCLILDIAMPGMSGPDLQRELAVRRRSIPIVYITAHGDASVRPRLLESGAVECLLKPFSDTALLAALNAALRVN